MELLPALKALRDEGRLRHIRYYTHSLKKGVVQNDVICCDENVDSLYEKFKRQGKQPRELNSKKYAGLCDKCQFTYCWDSGKAVRCAEFKKAN